MENKTVEILLVELKDSNNYNSKKLLFEQIAIESAMDNDAKKKGLVI
ncbi:hypothetical protein HYG86_11985 [Alkalicella caledoniensis]|uniref:Uncharacterized protein n=1 Tax=Alkalicella caledoniensis TaxID=2731377 RepID=A0A7G9W9S0_ALKCA|nr:hypothetical protein [Alkalicella caledoniensis]QNO15432.1 hypothetical protein HYG86_11985 [Alkalicella caledoniensis]